MRVGTAIGRGLVVGLAGAALMLGAPVASAAPPEDGGGTSDGETVQGILTVSPTSGPPGTSVEATRVCGDADEGWVITFRGGEPERDLGEDVFTYGTAGSLRFDVPDSALAGDFPVSAYCRRPTGTADGVNVRSTSFTVIVVEPLPPPSVSAEPSPARAGDEVVLSGDWLPACAVDAWTARFGGTSRPATVRSFNPIETFAASESRYTGEFGTTVPAGAPAGATEVGLACVGEVVASAPFEVTTPPVPPTSTTTPAGPTTGPNPGGSGGGSSGGGSGGGSDGGVGTDGTEMTSVVPSVTSGLLALAILGLVLRVGLRRAGREWAARHVQVVVRPGSVRR